jgi:hypothetical protein
VSRRAAADLAPDYAGRLVVAGRSAEKAGQLVAELGYRVRGKSTGFRTHLTLLYPNLDPIPCNTGQSRE